MLKSDPRLLAKLRQATGANYMLCHKAADEIVKLRKEVERLKAQVKSDQAFIDAAAKAI